MSDDLTALPIFQPGRAPGNGGQPAGPLLPPTTPATARTHSAGTANTGPADVARRDDYRDLDWDLVLALRKQAADTLVAQTRGRTLTPDQERDIGREIVTTVVQEHIAALVRSGTAADTSTPARQGLLAGAVFDAQFGLGRLQPLVDDDSIENIEVRGYDNVTLIYAGGLIAPGPPVADSDEQLLAQLQHLANRYGVTGRPFTETNPQLDLRLHGGHRLAASYWTSPRPYVTIRRHRLIDVTLDQLVQLNMLDTGSADFLAACVRARKSIVVAGEQGAGKTTLLRALCNEIDPWESIGTIETEFELHLHELPDKHHRVFAWEARPGNGQVGLDGRVAGEVTIDQLLRGSHRYNLGRLIIGEVRGGEVPEMFEAMQAGTGSLSTIHAGSAHEVVERLVTLVLKHTTATTEYAFRQVAHHIDVIVHIAMRDIPDDSGRPTQTRFVDSVVAVDPGENDRPALTDVFGMSGGQLRPLVAPRWLGTLAEVGYEPQRFVPQPLDGARP